MAGSNLEMGKKVLSFIKQVPPFLFLFPLFFVLHSYLPQAAFILFSDVVSLLIFYWIISIILLVCMHQLYKSVLKASIATVLVLSLNYFFGAIQDFLKMNGPAGFSRFSILVPLLLMLLFFLLYRLFRAGPLRRTTRYLDLLLALLILLDLGMFLVRNDNAIARKEWTQTSNTLRKDVHLLVLDGYAGQLQLEKEFNFRNDSFIQFLEQKQFSLADESWSNYSNTPFSMASLLNMEYLPLSDFEYTDSNLNYCFKRIYNNEVVSAFKANGYDFINNSIFDIDGKKAPVDKTFLISGTGIITSQTLFNRFRKEVLYNLLGKFLPGNFLYQQYLYSDRDNNENQFARLEKMASEKQAKPRFIYTHLMLPHFPYYFRANGAPVPVEIIRQGNYEDAELYLEYLQYCNSRISNTIEMLLDTPDPPVIIIISDHGFRKKDFSPQLSFNTINAVFIPGKKDFYSNSASISNVNFFRYFLNNMMGMKLEMQKDQIIK